MSTIDKERKIIVSCAPSTAPFVAEEVKALNLPVKKIGATDVETYGSLRDCMLLNLYLRTAHKILWVIDEMNVNSPDQLYQKVKKIEWENILLSSGFFSVDAFVRHETIRDFRFANLKVKDAIVDRLTEVFGQRPNTGKEKDAAVIFLHWVNDKASIALDTSGETIAKHGYRKNPWKAPLMESMAASILLATKWDRNQPLVNPMCGSGTLAIEAALMATNTPPGLFRNNFGFMHIKGYQPFVWKQLIKEAKEDIWDELNFPIIATDNHPRAIAAARENAQAAGVAHLITFEVCDFKKTTIPQEEGVIILNPEWGERLGEEEKLIETYKQIGDFFKQSCQGYTGYVFTGNLKLAKNVGLRTSRRIEFIASKTEGRLLEYELYGGSKK